VDWSKLPDIVAIGLLASAFASVARRNATRVSGIWLTGWLLVLLHFIAFVFLPIPGYRGDIAGVFGLASLIWAGVLFIWSSVPYRKEGSTRWVLAVLVLTNTLYVCVLGISNSAWMLNFAAALLGVGPLAVAVSAMRRFNHPLRWVTVVLYLGLALFLLLVQTRPANGPELALNAVLFTVYFDCGIHFWYTYRRATTGRFITVYGFFAWSSVFLFSPFKDAWFPNIHIENEVWNLPKYVVATGMILLLLEEQIEHNKHLALHDPLTGLPNRRLFEDRLANALERARRSGSQAALLVLDLDRFKHVNDTLGHHAGDLLLQRVAKIFGGRVRRSDTVARTGGDEFSVILEGPTNATEALHVGHSLQEMLKEPLQLENRTVRIGASLGVAIFPDDAPDMESLCIAADLRMYDNKREKAVPEKHHPKSEMSTIQAPKDRDSSRQRFPQ
jgi:diguanylate cyclase (GGDEF)-like protein